jgi:hypothetical protein
MTPRVRQRLLADAQGNPLALLELPVALAELPHSLTASVPAVLPLSQRLQAAFASRIKGLPSPTSELLLLAALDGTGDLRLIRRIADGREGQGLAPAERATHLVRADNTTERLLFRHPLIRSAVVDLSTSEQRRQAHRDLAEHLDDQPDRGIWHLAEATVEPDEHVAALLQGVAHANLRRGDSVGAVTQLLRAADLSPTGAGRSGRLAEAATHPGSSKPPAKHTQAAADRYPSQSPAPTNSSTATVTSTPRTGCSPSPSTTWKTRPTLTTRSSSRRSTRC